MNLYDDIKKYYEENERYCAGCLVRIDINHYWMCTCELYLTREKYNAVITQLHNDYYAIPCWKRLLQKGIWWCQSLYQFGQTRYRYEEWQKQDV
jgi:hypothetical protein